MIKRLGKKMNELRVWLLIYVCNVDCSNQYFPFIRKETLKFACQSSAECSCCFSHFLLVLGFKGVWFPDHQLALTSTECFPPQSIETEVSSFITAAKR